MSDKHFQFHYFPRLTSELRLIVWKLVPRPTRIIAQAPCMECMATEYWRPPVGASFEDHTERHHPD